MTDKEIEITEHKIGYHFNNKALLRQAFTRRSYYNEKRQAKDKHIECNEVLEFLGDSILGCTVAKTLVDKYSSADSHGLHSSLDEGIFSVIKSNLSDKSMLSGRIKDLELNKFFIMGEGDIREGIDNQPSAMEDLFESIIGAVFIDSGQDFEAAAHVVLNMLDIEKFLLSNCRKNAKNIVQEYAQANKLDFCYLDKGCDGPEHDRIFFRALVIDGQEYPTASGKNVKKAEMAAAETAIGILGI